MNNMLIKYLLDIATLFVLGQKVYALEVLVMTTDDIVVTYNHVNINYPKVYKHFETANDEEFKFFSKLVAPSNDLNAGIRDEILKSLDDNAYSLTQIKNIMHLDLKNRQVLKYLYLTNNNGLEYSKYITLLNPKFIQKSSSTAAEDLYKLFLATDKFDAQEIKILLKSMAGNTADIDKEYDAFYAAFFKFSDEFAKNLSVDAVFDFLKEFGSGWSSELKTIFKTETTLEKGIYDLLKTAGDEQKIEYARAWRSVYENPDIKNRSEVLAKAGKLGNIDWSVNFLINGGRFIAKSGTELKTYLDDLVTLPAGKTYNGQFYKSINTDFHPHPNPQLIDDYATLKLDHRYSKSGESGYYVSQTNTGNITEMGFTNGVPSNYKRYLYDNVSIDNMLDLTDDAVRQQLGITEEMIKKLGEGKYEYTHILGIWAKDRYKGVIYSGAQGGNYTNIMIFKQIDVDNALGNLKANPL